MSSDSNSVEDKTEDKVEENEEDVSKRKKIKILSDVGEPVDSDKNEDTKAEVSEASKDTSENTDSTVNSGDSSTSNSDVLVSNVDNSTNNSDNTSNESEQVESASSNICNSANSETECTDSNADAPKKSVDNDSKEAAQSDLNADTQKQSNSVQAEQSESNTDAPKQSSDNDTTQAEQSDSKVDILTQSSDKDTSQTEQSESKADAPTQNPDNDNKTEAEQLGSVTQDDKEASKSNPLVDKTENKSPGSSTDLICGNEKKTTTQADSDDKNEESKTPPNSIKSDQESLYELLNNPKEVHNNTNVNANKKIESSVVSNGSTEQTNTAVDQQERASTEIQKNDEITCEELLGILQEKGRNVKTKVLIIDVRNEEEYCKSRISFHNNIISIPAEKIQANKVPGYYRYILLYDIEAEKKFTRRSHYDIIVLVDKDSELKTMDSNSKIAIFKHSLEEYDVHIDYKRIAVLKGGFEKWTNLYPDFVTKS